MRRILGWLAVAVVLVGYDVYLLVDRLAEVQGNVEAQFIIITPGLILSHVLRRRRSDRQHQERMTAHDANATELAAHREEMAAVIEKVGELHDFHIGFKLPERELHPPQP